MNYVATSNLNSTKNLIINEMPRVCVINRHRITTKRLLVYLVCGILVLFFLLNSAKKINFDWVQKQEDGYKFSRLRNWNKSRNVHSETLPRTKIGIFLAIDDEASLSNYKTAMDSLQCYAKVGGYNLEIIFLNDNQSLSSSCPQTDNMFKRHCVAALALVKYDWMLFLDADIGVINPDHRIEEWIDADVPVIFYDRFFNWEVTAGTYLVKNAPYAIHFLNTWANYETKLPKSFHGTDNGAIHMILIDELAPYAGHERNLCQQLWKKSLNFADLFAFEACARFVLGANRLWPGKIKILQKGHGWARDGWLTKSKWSPRDFMIHGWQEKRLETTEFGAWSNPFSKKFNLSRCTPNDYSTNWQWYAEFQKSDEEIDQELEIFAKRIQKDFWKKAGQIANEI